MQSEKQQANQLDLLWGAQAIADFLGTTERKVWYQADRGLLPVNRQGRLLTASKSALRKHFGADDVSTAPAPPSDPMVAAPPLQPIEMLPPSDAR
jgi:hypothetical protein